MSAIEAGIYQRPDPNCPRCHGAGKTKASKPVRCRILGTHATAMQVETYIVRCPCTDAGSPRSEGGTMQAREAHQSDE